MANVFQSIAEKFRGLGELAEASVQSVRSKQIANEAERRLRERQAQTKPTVTSTGNIFKDIGQNLVPRVPSGTTIYEPTSQAGKAIRAAKVAGEQLREEVIAPKVNVATKAIPQTAFNVFSNISRLGGAVASRYGVFSTPEDKARRFKPAEGAKTVTEALQDEPFFGEVVERGVEKTPLGAVPYLAPVAGFLSEGLLPPYGGGALGKAKFLKTLARETSEDVIKSTLKSGIKDLAEEEATALAKQIAPLTDEAAIAKILEQPKDLEPLATEARKYKSAEEFIGANKELYNYTGEYTYKKGESKFFTPDIEAAQEYNRGKATLSKLFSDESKLYKGENSQVYAQKSGLLDKEMTPDLQKLTGFKTLRQVDDAYVGGNWKGASKEFNENPNIYYTAFQQMAAKDLRGKGFSGARWSYEDDLTPTQYQIWDESALKTKSQLTDFYNQAVKTARPVTTGIPKELEPLAIEARKYKSAEEFVSFVEKDVIGRQISMEVGQKTIGEVGEKIEKLQKIVGVNFVQRFKTASIEEARATFEAAKKSGASWARGRSFENPAVQLRAIDEATPKRIRAKDIGLSKSQLIDFYNKAVGSSAQPPTPPKMGVVRGGTPVRPEPTKPPVETLPKEVEQITNRTSGTFDQVYHNSGGGARNSLAVETELSPVIAGSAPEKFGIFTSFKEKVGRAWLATREFIEDEMVRVKKLVQDPNVKVTEDSNPYQAEILFHGRVGARMEEVKDLVNAIDKDILVASKRLGIPDEKFSADVNRYLHARHAPERNAQVGTGASGMFTDDAVRIVREIESSPQGVEVKRIADRLQELNNKTLDVLLEGEVIDEELYSLLREKYENHVPLNRVFEGTEDVGQALASRPFDVRGTGIVRAKGSLRQVADIQANIVANYEQAILRAEKNRVDLATLKFVRDNPESGLFQEVKPKAIGKTFEGKIIKERIDDPQTLVLREKGKPVFIKINDPHLAAALRGINRHKVDGVMRVVQSITRFYSGLATRFNPEFAFPNKIRDLQEAMVYAGSKSELGVKGALKTVVRDPQSVKSVVEAIRGKGTEGARLYNQMRLDGGTTGGMGLSTRKQVEIDLNAMRKTNRSNPRLAARKIIELVDVWNTIFEDSTRLSVYRTALEQGATRARAAVLAKEASVNFNKFGKGGPVVNALYMFANASIQGSAKMLRAMKNPKVAATVVTTIGVAVAATNEWNDSVDPDWRDKVTTWDRLNSLPIMIPNADGGVTYFTIPVSWGMKPIKVAFDYAYDAIGGKGVSFGDSVSGVMAAIVEGYNPVGGTDLVSAITPTILDLPSDIARNRAWHGGMIKPDWDANAPASIEYFDSLKDSATGRTLIAVSKGLSGLGIEVSPADLNYAYETLIGGAGRAGSKVINTISSVSQGEIPEAREIPFASRFLRSRSQEEVGAGSREYEEIKDVLGEQSRQRFVLNQQAEDAYNQMKALPKEEANKRFNELAVVDRELAEKIAEIAKEEKLGFTYTDRLIKQLGVTNGERAKYLKKKFDQLKTKEEKNALWEEYVRKEIITKNVSIQLNYLLSQ